MKRFIRLTIMGRGVGRYFLCIGIIVVSIMPFEKGAYALILGGGLLFSMLLVALVVSRILIEFIPERILPWRIRIASFIPAFFLALYFVVFSKYLNGGTMFIQSTPLILEGKVTFAGILFVFAYSLVLTINLALLSAENRNG